MLLERRDPLHIGASQPERDGRVRDRRDFLAFADAARLEAVRPIDVLNIGGAIGQDSVPGIVEIRACLIELRGADGPLGPRAGGGFGGRRRGAEIDVVLAGRRVVLVAVDPAVFIVIDGDRVGRGAETRGLLSLKGFVDLNLLADSQVAVRFSIEALGNLITSLDTRSLEGHHDRCD